MNSNPFDIDPRLLHDSHELFSWNQCNIRLHKNASIPWLLIIPQTDHVELCDLPTDQLSQINQLSKVLGDYLKTTFSCEKINFAAIGNVVQQLHIHVVGRHRNDPVWPDVVWGNPYPKTEYSPAQISQHADDLLAYIHQEL